MEFILKALESFNYHRTKTAKHLGISKRTLRYYLMQFRNKGYYIPDNPNCPYLKFKNSNNKKEVK